MERVNLSCPECGSSDIHATKWVLVTYKIENAVRYDHAELDYETDVARIDWDIVDETAHPYICMACKAALEEEELVVTPVTKDSV